MSDHQLTVLDGDRLASLIEEIGDRDLVRQAVQTFLDELPGRLEAIRSAVATGDRNTIRSSAHALGSPAAMLGATSIAVASRSLEAAAKTDDPIDLDSLLSDVEDGSFRCERAIRDYLEAPLPA